MTAAATTGPNNEPRPTSSTPAIRRAPVCHASFSNFRVQRRRLSRRSLAADGESVFARAGLAFTDTTQSRERNKSIFAERGVVKQGGKPSRRPLFDRPMQPAAFQWHPVFHTPFRFRNLQRQLLFTRATSPTRVVRGCTTVTTREQQQPRASLGRARTSRITTGENMSALALTPMA